MGFGDHIFKFMESCSHESIPEPGYMSSLVSIRDYSAVTAACMMIRATLFRTLNGFDENIKIGYGDTDLCLRARALGYEILFTPYALMYHHESLSRKGLNDPEAMEHRGDTSYFCRKWADLLSAGDPFYNPNLSLNSYRCDPRL
jgi:GT2 family glycosyltransferase